MFIGFVLSVLIIVFYAIYVSGKYATKKEMEDLRRRLDDLEKTPERDNSKVAASAGVVEGQK